MRKLHANGFDTANSIVQGLANLNFSIEPGDRILDLGCGEGLLVYRFRELGYEAYGFDIHNYVKLHRQEDENLFKFLKNPKTNSADMAVVWSNYRLPFDSDSFDLVVSTQTLEHVLEPIPVMAEIARILRPNGISLHLYPARSWLIEPHFYVPLATRIQSWWWFYLWALLGVRNEHQSMLSAREVADANFFYCQTGVRYLTNYEIRVSALKYFKDASFPRKLYYGANYRRGAWRERWLALRSRTWLARLALIPDPNVLLTAGKHLDTARVKGVSLKEPAGANQLELSRAFGSWGGFAYSVDLKGYLDFADTNEAPTRSTLVLCEDGKPLGPAHSKHEDIITEGRGRYSHWINGIVFSASDNSNPNWNNRHYSVFIDSDET